MKNLYICFCFLIIASASYADCGFRPSFRSLNSCGPMNGSCIQGECSPMSNSCGPSCIQGQCSPMNGSCGSGACSDFDLFEKFIDEAPAAPLVEKSNSKAIPKIRKEIKAEMPSFNQESF
ncbi:MAG: hypothetical protein WCG45_05090 [bacterium]